METKDQFFSVTSVSVRQVLFDLINRPEYVSKPSHTASEVLVVSLNHDENIVSFTVFSLVLCQRCLHSSRSSSLWYFHTVSLTHLVAILETSVCFSWTLGSKPEIFSNACVPSGTEACPGWSPSCCRLHRCPCRCRCRWRNRSAGSCRSAACREATGGRKTVQHWLNGQQGKQKEWHLTSSAQSFVLQ